MIIEAKQGGCRGGAASRLEKGEAVFEKDEGRGGAGRWGGGRPDVPGPNARRPAQSEGIAKQEQNS
jgi:hypothetical protein